jgi:hypothetical protein
VFLHQVPAPSVYVRQIAPRRQQATFFEGPVPVQCEVWISNVATQPLVLKTIELHTGGDGAFAFASEPLRFVETIPAGGTVSFTVTIWAWSDGGDFGSSSPVPLAGTAWFSVHHEPATPVTFKTFL